MTTGGAAGGFLNEINVTPMIDILLVLLIIFMVIVPVTPKGLDALVPQPPKDPQNRPHHCGAGSVPPRRGADVQDQRNRRGQG
jgi:biopolymer transport protein ExbD